MNALNNLGWGKQVEHADRPPAEFGQAANVLCAKALEDALARLHPLIRSTDVRFLSQRIEFVQAFKRSLEQRVAQKLAAWQPAVQAVYSFDESWMESRERWDGSIHLLVKVPRLLSAVRSFGKNLDKSLVETLKQLGWSRFQKRHSVLNVQQVTSSELRHGIGYGAMFSAVHSRPVKVWPLKART
ncbi:MAG TPA: hypothetical protein VFY26_00710 [Anaerolineales bacterium]|nr:hypothetical protein [Anaerolineales bacterium]